MSDDAEGEEEKDYGIAEIVDLEAVEAPDLPYKPDDPDGYDPNIALIGTGGISEQHLDAYTSAGYSVVALCNRTREKAVARNEEYELGADIYSDYTEVLDREDIDVVDITVHPEPRAQMIEDAILAGKHVLSQKPFVVDLDVGEQLVELAAKHNVKLAVNQNGRWAPHWSYIREALKEDLIGEVHGAHLNVDWNHDWIADTDLDDIGHAILFDFAVHWFDILTCIFPDREFERVFASAEHSPSQNASPPMLGQALVELDGAQASLSFNADTKLGPEDRTYLSGTRGTIMSEGEDLEEQDLTIYTEDGYGSPDLEGTWFPDGFHGAMAELLSAIEEDREPSNSGRGNIKSLELCYAAVASAEDGEAKVPGNVRGIPPELR